MKPERVGKDWNAILVFHVKTNFHSEEAITAGEAEYQIKKNFAAKNARMMVSVCEFVGVKSAKRTSADFSEIID